MAGACELPLLPRLAQECCCFGCWRRLLLLADDDLPPFRPDDVVSGLRSSLLEEDEEEDRESVPLELLLLARRVAFATLDTFSSLGLVLALRRDDGCEPT